MQTILLILFFVLWAGALFGGFAFGTLNADETHRIPRRNRMLSSVMLTLAAWTWFVLGVDESLRDVAVWIAVGMSFGLLGDLFMAKLIIRSDAHVLAGMGAFGVGHVAYIVGFLRYVETLPDGDNSRTLIWVAWMLVAVALWYLTVWRTAPEKSAPTVVALPYALLLASTAGVAMGIATLSAGFWVVTLGAALFLASDLLLALQLFNGWHFRGIGDVVWLTYGPAQMLIVYGMVAVGS